MNTWAIPTRRSRSSGTASMISRVTRWKPRGRASRVTSRCSHMSGTLVSGRHAEQRDSVARHLRPDPADDRVRAMRPQVADAVGARRRQPEPPDEEAHRHLPAAAVEEEQCPLAAGEAAYPHLAPAPARRDPGALEDRRVLVHGDDL